jgi:hypothetical protein
MNKYLLLFLISILVLVNNKLHAQNVYTKFEVNKKMKDTFSFAKKWDYSWDVFKDDSTGEFSIMGDDAISKSDTTHLFYTANCTTDIQGGYDIRYSYASQKNKTITLSIYDGLPAYGSEFSFYIKNDKFYFRPHIVYPMRRIGEKKSYVVTKQKIILNKSRYKIGDKIMGYIEAEFMETISIPNKGTQRKKFYIKGYIRTILK